MADKKLNMKIGDSYNFENNQIRIILFDDKEVFYQTINDDNSFVYSNYRTINYYRTSLKHFYKNSHFIESLELTEKEYKTHRPDLPLRLNCFSGVFWVASGYEHENNLIDLLKSKGIDKKKIQGLNCSKVAIYPTGQQQSNKKPILLENKNGHFSGLKLIMECFRIQSEYVNPDKPYFSRYRLIPNGREEKRLSGIGMYRLGIKGNIPSYYLGGEISMMELESQKSCLVQK
ncbi:hypothetical protein [Flagellimonas sp.]|uniref:hypothetical protein n=1 Tax=Flagellimonas sp. TaxID=2058762 RepID=UPI003BAA8708